MCLLVTPLQAKGGKEIIMTMEHQAFQPWLRGNVAIAMSQGVPKAEIDGVSNGKLGTCRDTEQVKNTKGFFS